MDLMSHHFIIELLNFRFNIIRILLKKQNLILLSEFIPDFKIDRNEFNSFKYYILKQLVLNGRIIINQPYLFSFKENFFPAIRYEQIQMACKFKELSKYTGDLYFFIQKYDEFINLIIKSKNYQEFTGLKDNFKKILDELNFNLINKNSIEQCDSFCSFIHYDLDSRDYDYGIILDIMDEKDFSKFCFEHYENRTIFPVLGFYKAFLISFYYYTSKSCSKKQYKILYEKIITLKDSISIENFHDLFLKTYYNDKNIKLNDILKDKPEYWPWIFTQIIGNEVRKLK